MLGIFLDGWILQNLWTWHFMPHFAWAPTLSFQTSAGIMLIVSFATAHFGLSFGQNSILESLGESKREAFIRQLSQFVSTVLSHLFLLGVAWVLHAIWA